MVTMMVRCWVEDYDAWRAEWLPALEQHYAKGRSARSASGAAPTTPT